MIQEGRFDRFRFLEEECDTFSLRSTRHAHCGMAASPRQSTSPVKEREIRERIISELTPSTSPSPYLFLVFSLFHFHSLLTLIRHPAISLSFSLNRSSLLLTGYPACIAESRRSPVSGEGARFPPSTTSFALSLLQFDLSRSISPTRTFSSLGIFTLFSSSDSSSRSFLFSFIGEVDCRGDAAIPQCAWRVLRSENVSGERERERNGDYV